VHIHDSGRYKEKFMESELLAGFHLGAIAFAATVLGGIVLALVLLLRQNRKDLDVLEEELESKSADDDETATDSKPRDRS
jgi:hypothetical protein